MPLSTGLLQPKVKNNVDILGRATISGSAVAKASQYHGSDSRRCMMLAKAVVLVAGSS